MNSICESISYEIRNNNPKGDCPIMACITPCPYIEDKIVAGAGSCDSCRFFGGCNSNSTVRCSYRHFMRSELKLKAYEKENAWWYYFFQASGSNNYDAEYANSLRINGVSPQEAAEKARIQILKELKQ